MINNFIITLNNFYQTKIVGYLQELYQYPIKLVALIIDVSIVLYLLYFLFKIGKDTRAWQLLKGIGFLIIITAFSKMLKLNIVNYILNYFMDYIVIILIVVFQPELRRALEQIGRKRFSKYFELEKDSESKIKEAIYKVSIAASEMSKTKTGALIVFERDIRLSDIVNTGIEINGDISPQILVNIFCTRTPLHDGAVVIKNNKILSAACMLPLSNDQYIEKEYGTRHRAAIGVTAESDAIAVVVSEETGYISVSKDGKLIPNIDEDKLKKFLIANLISKPNKIKS